MKNANWDKEKNLHLIKERGISFEEIVEDIKKGHILDRVDHPNQTKYPDQQVYIIIHKNYCYMVPFVESETGFFLKTIIPSRKKTKEYLKKGGQNE
ncbi:MAG: BrnT family toxin [Candidatus Aminicenantes bacterium]|nr:BrnT family toxin [Candidatus Aminicenantes bacterium]